MSSGSSARIAVFGDLHGSFDAVDAAWINGDRPDGVLFVGDLGGRHGDIPPLCAAAMASIGVPAWWIPGNHDGVTFPQLAAEIVGPELLARRLSAGMGSRVDEVAAAIRPVRRVGWCSFEVAGVAVVAGRPHSMGGPAMAFTSWLAEHHGIGSLEQSERTLRALVRSVDADRPVVLLAHNGPTGFGAEPTSLFGRDFMPAGGDWGDVDLAGALAEARNGRRVVAVAAGHMHHRTRGGEERRRWASLGDAVVVNAARVPRQDMGRRWHVELVFEDGQLTVHEVTVRAGQATRAAVARAAVGGG